MISRLVTVDLLVTATTRLNDQLPEEAALGMLNRWAQKIETLGVSVSLNCILDNAFWLKSQQQYVGDDYEELGLRLYVRDDLFAAWKLL
jgi:hypothetical protein